MEKLILVCDRCGDEIVARTDTMVFGEYWFGERYSQTQEMDLCEGCSRSFEDFMGGAE